ncbi:MAG: ATP-binding protein, partial [Bacteroidota bacterium]
YESFVENAIIHGLKNCEGGGAIRVEFSGNVEEIIVEIEDNGIGFDPSAAQKEDSLGMGITRKRLELMQKNTRSIPSMEVIPLLSSQGQPIGTLVVIRIAPNVLTIT